MATDVAWHRVGDSCSTVQDCVNQAAVTGGVVYVPHGTGALSTTLQIPASPNPEKPLIIRGDGPSVSKLSTAFVPFGTADVVNVQRSRVTFEGLSIEPQNLNQSEGRGIVIGGGSDPVSDVVLRDCIVRGSGRHVLYMAGPLSNVLVERCVFAANYNPAGLLARIGPLCRGVAFIDCSFDFFKGSAIELVGCRDISFYDGHVETAEDKGTAPFVTGIDAENCHFGGVWFEEAQGATSNQWFLDIGRGCNGWTIVGCYFVRQRTTGMTGALRLIRLGSCTGTPAGPALGAAILNPLVTTTFSGDPEPGAIEIRDSSSEVCVIGGTVQANNNTSMRRYPVDIADSSTKSTWIGPRGWRPPLVGLSQTLDNGKLGDLLARPGRGLEMWNAKGTPKWLPASVNRYVNEVALAEIPEKSKDPGTVVWIDNVASGASKLRVWTGTSWAKVEYL